MNTNTTIEEPAHKTRKEAYHEYLQSEDWRKKRKETLERSNGCFVCRGHKKIHVHHVQYRQWYNVTQKDLVAMCEDCHLELHECFRKGMIRTNVKTKYEIRINLFLLHKDQGTRIEPTDRHTRLRRMIVEGAENTVNFFENTKDASKIENILRIQEVAKELAESVKKEREKEHQEREAALHKKLAKHGITPQKLEMDRKKNREALKVIITKHLAWLLSQFPLKIAIAYLDLIAHMEPYEKPSFL